jgi:NAD(P)H-dependent FMN reductase
MPQGEPVLNLMIIVGSTRAGRGADNILPWLTTRARADGRFAVDVLDLRTLTLPMFAETFETVGDPRNPSYSEPSVAEWNRIVGAGDAFLFLTPEYNHSIPAVLKNAIDTVFASFAFRNKPAGAVAYSGGRIAGARAVEQLALIAVEAELVPMRNAVLIPAVHQAFNSDGSPRDPATETAADVLLDDLAWWADVLHQARVRGELAPARLRQRTSARTPSSS